MTEAGFLIRFYGQGFDTLGNLPPNVHEGGSMVAIRSASDHNGLSIVGTANSAVHSAL